LGILNTRQTEIADLEIAVFVDKNVARFKITMHYAGGMHIFETAQNLVEEILDELLLERSGGEKTMEIRSEKFGDKV
jgi:hypothetical protein